MSNLPLRPELNYVQAYGAPQIDVPVKLNTNENPYSPPPQVQAAMATAATQVFSTLNRYPDRDALELRTALATYLSRETGARIDLDQVWAANGSNEVMLQLLQTYGGPGHRALTFTPTYSMYEEYARDSATEFVAIARDSDFVLSADRVQEALTQHAPQVVFFASPNNPTGTALELHLVELALGLLPDSIIVVDEAYAEFRRAGTQSAINLLAEHPNLVVTRTMSKAFACAGLRVGYMAASAEIVNHVKLVRLPYHLSSVSQAIATVALQHAADLQKDLQIIRQERDGLVQWLSESGFQTAPSDANFVLFGTFSNRHAVWQALVDRGVLVREVGPEGWLRVTIGAPEEMAVFRTALLETRDASL